MLKGTFNLPSVHLPYENKNKFSPKFLEDPE